MIEVTREELFSSRDVYPSLLHMRAAAPRDTSRTFGETIGDAFPDDPVFQMRIVFADDKGWVKIQRYDRETIGYSHHYADEGVMLVVSVES